MVTLARWIVRFLATVAVVFLVVVALWMLWPFGSNTASVFPSDHGIPALDLTDRDRTRVQCIADQLDRDDAVRGGYLVAELDGGMVRIQLRRGRATASVADGRLEVHDGRRTLYWEDTECEG